MAAHVVAQQDPIGMVQSSAKATTLKAKTPVHCAKRAEAVRTVFFFPGVHSDSKRGIELNEYHWSLNCSANRLSSA